MRFPLILNIQSFGPFRLLAIISIVSTFVGLFAAVKHLNDATLLRYIGLLWSHSFLAALELDLFLLIFPLLLLLFFSFHLHLQLVDGLTLGTALRLCTMYKILQLALEDSWAAHRNHSLYLIADIYWTHIYVVFREADRIKLTYGVPL